MLTRGFLLVSVIAVLASCCKQEASDEVMSYFKDTPSIVLAPENSVGLEQFDILVPIEIIRYKDSYIFRKGLSENYVDILTPERAVISCVKKGRGPGELTDVGSLQLRGDTLYVFGPSQKKLLALDIPGTIASQKQITLKEYQIENLDRKVSDQMVLPVNLQVVGEHFYGLGMFGDGSLYAELSRDGSIVSGIPGPMLEDSKLSSLDRNSLNMDAQMTVSPDGSRIAVAYSQIAAISFGYTQPTLTNLWFKVFYQPKLWYPDRAGFMVSYEKENKTTFQDMQAFDDVVYALYSGKNRVGDNENRANHCDHLLVFDWNGTPLRHFELEESIAGFWVEDDTLYGISFSPAAKLYQFKPVNAVPLSK